MTNFSDIETLVILILNLHNVGNAEVAQIIKEKRGDNDHTKYSSVQNKLYRMWDGRKTAEEKRQTISDFAIKVGHDRRTVKNWIPERYRHYCGLTSFPP